MMKIINDDKVHIFDETGWGDTVFHPISTARDLLSNIERIDKIEFYSIENVLVISIDLFSFWFRDMDLDFLNFLCSFPQLRNAVTKFILRGFLMPSIINYPLLMASVLGNNNED